MFPVFRVLWLLPLLAGPIAGMEAYHYLRLKYKQGKHILSEEQQLDLSQAKSNFLKFSVIFFLTVVLVFFT